MNIRTEPFRRPGKAPLLWNRTVCDCHWYYQFYLCGCPDRATPIGNGRTRHEPCYQGCEVWYKPLWEQVIKLSSGFRHNPNPPLRPEPSVLPFPCYRHLMESRIFLSAEELHTMRNRLMDPEWNPVRAARLNKNHKMLRRFQEQSSSWEDKKRVREEEDDGLPPPPPLRRRVLQPETEEVIQLQPMLGDLMVGLRRAPDDHHYIDPPAPNAALVSPPYSWQIPSGQVAFPTLDGPRIFLLPDGSDQDENWSQDSRSQNSLGRSPPPPYVGPPAYTRSPPRPPPPTLPQGSPPPYRETPYAASTQQTARDTSGLSPAAPHRSRGHFSSLTWLLEEQSIDLWRQDGYHWHSAPLKREDAITTSKQQRDKKKKQGTTIPTSTLPPLPTRTLPPLPTSTLPPLPTNLTPTTARKTNPNAVAPEPPLVLDPAYDGPTHTGYFGGAYRTDSEVLHWARAVSWQRLAGADGLAWARRVGEAWAAGGGLAQQGGEVLGQDLLGQQRGQQQGQQQGQLLGGGGGGWWLGGRFHM